MAKTYILEPTEITTTTAQTGSVCYISVSNELIETLNSLDSNAMAEYGGITLKYANKIEETEAFVVIFTPDGSFDLETQPDHYLTITYEELNPGDLGIGIPDPAGTYTVSIYTGEDDEEGGDDDPTPSGGLTPITREEMYLSAIAGLTTLPSGMKPITRKEMFLDAILNGGSSETPVTREEMYLDAIANKE